MKNLFNKQNKENLVEVIKAGLYTATDVTFGAYHLVNRTKSDLLNHAEAHIKSRIYGEDVKELKQHRNDATTAMQDALVMCGVVAKNKTVDMFNKAVDSLRKTDVAEVQDVILIEVEQSNI